MVENPDVDGRAFTQEPTVGAAHDQDVEDLSNDSDVRTFMGELADDGWIHDQNI